MKIAFCARAGAGKTTFADYLVKEKGFKRIAFADALKEVCVKYFGMTTKDRTLLQTVGSKFREIDPEIWIKLVVQKIKYGQYVNIVIDDCRYPNEAEALKELGFKIIKITNRQYEMTPEQMAHPSESQMDQIRYNYELDNSGSLEESFIKLNEILKQVGE